MGTKAEPGEFDCYAALLPDEPYFVLSARDPEAAFLVRAWARNRDRQIDDGERPVGDRAKVAEARHLADQMERWRADNAAEAPWRKRADDVEVMPPV